jgi:hypothetical protein
MLDFLFLKSTKSHPFSCASDRETFFEAASSKQKIRFTVQIHGQKAPAMNRNYQADTAAPLHNQSNFGMTFYTEKVSLWEN